MTAARQTSVRASLAWSYGVQALIFAVTFGGMVAVSHLLTPRELGIFGVGFAITTMLATFSYFGVSNFLVREEALEPRIVAACFTVNAIACLAIAAVLLGLGTAGAALFRDQAVPAVLRLLALVPILGIAEFVPSSLFTREMRFGALSLVQLGKAAVNAAVMLATAWAGWSYLSPALGAVAGAGFGAIAFSVAGRAEANYRISLHRWREIVTFAAHLVTAGGVPVLAARALELVVAERAGLAALGLYTRASQLAAIVWDGAYGLSTKVIYVQLAADKREGRSLAPTFLRSVRLLTAVMWPLVAGIGVLSGPIVTRLYGPQWSGAVLPLVILMVAMGFALSYAMSWELCVLAGRTAWQTRVETLRAALGLLVAGLLAPLGIAAVASGRLVEGVVGYALYRPAMPGFADTTAADLREATSGNLLLAGVAVAPAAFVHALYGWRPDTPLLPLIAAVVSGIGLWALLLARTKHLLWQEARAALRSR